MISILILIHVYFHSFKISLLYFRVNTALTKGYEEDVGTKTSFYCFTPITLTNTLAASGKFGFKSPPGNEDVRYVFFADNVWTYQLLNAYIRGVEPPRSSDKYHR